MTGNSGWDVVFPTHSRLAPMARNGLLAPLDHAAPAFAGQSRCALSATRLGPGSALGRALYVERDRHRLQPDADGRAARLGRALESRAARPHDHAGRSRRRDRRLSAEARAIRSTPTTNASLQAAQSGSHRAEAAAARLSQRGSARSAGSGRRTRRAALVHHRRAGDSAASRSSASSIPRKAIPLYCDCAVHPAREHAATNWRTSFSISCCGRMSPPPTRAWPKPRPPTARRRSCFRGIRCSIRRTKSMPRNLAAALPSAAQRYRDRLWTEIKSA